MPRRVPRPTIVVLIAWIIAGLAAPGARSQDPAPGPPEPPSAAVALLGPVDGATAVAVSASGVAAAAAFPPVEARGPARLRLAVADGDGVQDLELPGTARALVFSTDGATLWILVHRAAKRGPGDAWISRLDVGSLRAWRGPSLPPSSSDLALLPPGDVLAVACEGEIRTFRVPEVASGLLFVLPGRNASIGAIPGSRRILVGRQGEIVLVDLRDPQGREGIPVRGRIAVPGLVQRISVAPDGSSALAHLDDGRVVDVRFDSLLVPPDGEAPASSIPPSPPAETAVVAADAQATEDAREGPPPPLPPPPPPAPPTPAVTPDPEPEAAALPPPPALEEPRPATDGSAALRGAIVGEAAGRVAAVVLYGPDNLLREAARATPDASGRWSVRGLAPGAYRVVPDGGGRVQLVSDPPFRSVRAEANQDLRVDAFRVERAL